MKAGLLILAALATFGTVESQAAAETIRFAIMRDGQPIGTNTIELGRYGAETTVKMVTHIQVKIAFMTVYRFDQTETERYGTNDEARQAQHGWVARQRPDHGWCGCLLGNGLGGTASVCVKSGHRFRSSSAASRECGLNASVRPEQDTCVLTLNQQPVLTRNDRDLAARGDDPVLVDLAVDRRPGHA